MNNNPSNPSNPHTCAHCKWLQVLDSYRGECRRSSPTHAGFPRVLYTQWCGLFEPNVSREEASYPEDFSSELHKVIIRKCADENTGDLWQDARSTEGQKRYSLSAANTPTYTDDELYDSLDTIVRAHKAWEEAWSRAQLDQGEEPEEAAPDRRPDTSVSGDSPGSSAGHFCFWGQPGRFSY